MVKNKIEFKYGKPLSIEETIEYQNIIADVQDPASSLSTLVKERIATLSNHIELEKDRLKILKSLLKKVY